MKIRTLTFLLLAAVLAYGSEASAQRMFPNSDPVSRALTADDTDEALRCKYVGSSPFSTIQVSSGDLLFKTGTSSADTADATVTGCGATAGTLDVDNAACDTLGELVDKINGTATNWRCVIIDGLRTDVTSGATFVTMAATNASATAGLAIKWDTSVNFEASQCLNCPRTMEAYLSNPNTQGSGLIPNPFAGTQSAFVIGNFTSTYASGTSTLKIFSVKPKNVVGIGSETATSLYAVAGGATTVAKELNYHPYGILSNKDEKLLVRIDNSAAAGSVLIYAYGETWKYRGQ